MNTEQLSTSEVNLIVAALMLTSIRYEATKEHPKEAVKYAELEQKFRRLCYYGDEIATLQLIPKL